MTPSKFASRRHDPVRGQDSQRMSLASAVSGLVVLALVVGLAAGQLATAGGSVAYAQPAVGATAADGQQPISLGGLKGGAVQSSPDTVSGGDGVDMHDTAPARPKGGGPAGTPVRFEANRGQFPDGVEFVARTAGYTLRLTEQAAMFRLTPPPKVDAEAGGAGDTVTLRFADTPTEELAVDGVDRLPGETNYLTGADASGPTGVPAYQRVRYDEVWPGIDVVFYVTDEGDIEYDFEIAAGADPDQITLAIGGAEAVGLTQGGDLVLDTAVGPLRQSRPELHQPSSDGGREPVSGSFDVTANRVGFDLGGYDEARPLVIDPVVSYGTPAIGGDHVAVHNGHTYLAFTTQSTDMATTDGAYQPDHSELGEDSVQKDVVVAKLAADGSEVVWATYLGGHRHEQLGGLTVGPNGRTYVTGATESSNFPTTDGAFQSSLAGGKDAFLAVLSADGVSAHYATMLGGSVRDIDREEGVGHGGIGTGVSVEGAAGGNDISFGVAVSQGSDGGVRVHIAGDTTSPDFPATAGAHDEKCGSAGQCNLDPYASAFHPRIEATWIPDGFVATVDPSAGGDESLVWASFLGGNRAEHAEDIDADTEGRVYVAGDTVSGNFPTTEDAYDNQGGCPSLPPSHRVKQGTTIEVQTGCDVRDGFVAVLSSDGSAVDYATYVGTNPDEAVYTGRSEIPEEQRAAYANDEVTDVAVDDSGRVHVLGRTGSPTRFEDEVATSGALQGSAPDDDDGEGEPFVAGLDPAASGDASLAYASFLPAGDTEPRDIAAGAGGVYLAGSTKSEDFPTTDGAVQDELAGWEDAFALRMRRDGTQLAWSTFLGGSSGDQGRSVAVEAPQVGVAAVYVTGSTDGFAATAGAFNGDGFKDGDSEFVVRLVPGSGSGEGLGGTPGEPAPPPLTIDSLTPRGGLPTGGTAVTLTGTGLARASRVTFGDATLACSRGGDARCERVSGTKLRVIAPPHEPGVVEVSVVGAAASGEDIRTESEEFTYGVGTWEPLPNAPEGSRGQGVRLADGRVLLGGTKGMFIYDPGDGEWTSVAEPDIPRVRETLTLLDGPACEDGEKPDWCGKVLVAGGQVPGATEGSPVPGEGLVATAELFDPDTGEWSETGRMVEPVHSHRATVLTEGPHAGGVLVTGGCQFRTALEFGCQLEGRQQPHAEVYDPRTGTWRLTNQQPAYPRIGHAAARLPGGEVLAVSGHWRGRPDCGRCTPQERTEAPSEIYHPTTGQWTQPPAGPPETMGIQRIGHDAAWLSGGPGCAPHCGKLLVAGGVVNGEDDPELYDPDAENDAETWRGAAQQTVAPNGTVVGLPDGRGLHLGRGTELFEPGRQSEAEGLGAWAFGVPPPGKSGQARGGLVLSGDADEFVADPQACGRHCGKVLASTAEGPMLFTPPPTVTGVSPSAGPAAGGSEVTVTGTGFTHGLTRVSFGEHTIQCPTSAACQVDSYGQLTITDTPAHPGGGPVSVTVANQGGPSRPDEGPVFTYEGSPGQVGALSAEGISADTVEVSWQAVGDGRGGVAGDYVVKQAPEPIDTEAEFAAARSVCGDQPCHPEPTLSEVGQPARVRVGNLAPGTTYHYAIQAVADDGRTGPISEPVSATTLAGDDTTGADGTDGTDGTDGDGAAGGGATSGGEDDPVLSGGTRPADETEPDDGINAGGSDDGPARASRTGCPQRVVPAAGFGDTAGSVHQDSIDCVAWYGLTVGRGDLDGDGQADYTPGQPVTRAQMATFLTRLAVEAGVALPDQPGDAFTDDDGGVHEPAVNELAGLGLVKGTGQGRYSPNAVVSRAQMASFLMRLHEHATDSRPADAGDVFGDDDGSVHEANINALAALGVTQGRSDGVYAPQAPVSRGQMASFLARQVGVLVEAGAAYQGGAHVTLTATETTPGGELAGQVVANKPVESLVAHGCGLTDQPIQVDTQGRFAVAIPAGQPAGECALDLAVTTVRPEQSGFAQTAPYRFTIIVAPPDGGG